MWLHLYVSRRKRTILRRTFPEAFGRGRAGKKRRATAVSQKVPPSTLEETMRRRAKGAFRIVLLPKVWRFFCETRSETLKVECPPDQRTNPPPSEQHYSIFRFSCQYHSSGEPGQTHQILLTGSAPPVSSRLFVLSLRDPSRPDVRRPRGLPASGASPRGADAGDYGSPAPPCAVPLFLLPDGVPRGRGPLRRAFRLRRSRLQPDEVQLVPVEQLP